MAASCSLWRGGVLTSSTQPSHGSPERPRDQPYAVGRNGAAHAANILPGATKEFRSRRPDVRIRLFDADMTSIVQQIKAGDLDIGFGFFKSTPGIHRTRFFLFPLMVIHPESGTVPRRRSMTWSALKGERLILQAPPAPLRQLIDEHLAQAGVDAQSAMVLNRLDTLIAMVELGKELGSCRLLRCR
jgi:DNA-binding transcriptional LysR family regulator